MMNVREMMAQANQTAAAEKARLVEQSKPKPRYRVRNGKIVIRMAAVMAEPSPEPQVETEPKRAPRKVTPRLPQETRKHVLGGICPHCEGKKRYRWHIDGREGKCYRCHGKGVLDGKDFKFLNLRYSEDRPICHVVSA